MSEPAMRGELRHPISVVSERTGVSQDVLRMWERRYGVVRAERTAGGHRLYSDADIERIRRVRKALSGGRRIGQVARLSDAELALLVEEDRGARTSAEPDLPVLEDRALVEHLLALARAYDARSLTSLLRRSAALHGGTAFLERVASPLLQRIGDEWHAGRLSIASEHLASNTISELTHEILRTLTVGSGARRILVATPPGSRHAIGALMASVAGAAAGYDVIYLGADVPGSDVVVAAHAGNVRVVAISVVYSADVQETVRALTDLRRALRPDIALVVGGQAVAGAVASLRAAGIEYPASLPGFRAYLEQVG